MHAPVCLLQEPAPPSGAARTTQSPCLVKKNRLLVVLLLGVTAVTARSGLCALTLDAAGTATAVGRVQGKVNVLLRVQTNDKRGNVDDLLADADVALADEDTGVVDRLGKTV